MDMTEETQDEPQSKNSTLATVAGVSGLLAFFFAPAGLLAVILGHIGLYRVNRSDGALRGKGLCIFGLVMGYLAILLVIFLRSQ